MKTTKTKILNNYRNVVKVGYCELQRLLRTKERNFFTSGTYGWNADIYQVNHNTVIVTGYRPFGNIRPDYDLTERYENEAEKIICSNLDFEVKDAKLTELIEQFIEEVLGAEA